MKRGGVVRLACKPHELVVAGSNPAPASISTYRYIPTWVPNSVPKDTRGNIILFSQHSECHLKKRLISASFRKTVIFVRDRKCARFAWQIVYVNRLKGCGRQHCVLNRVCIV